MSRYIDADALIEWINGTGCFMDVFKRVTTDIINKQPTVDAVPVVHGEWIFNGRFAELNHYACSNCNRTEFRMSDYCPNCGAKMDGKENANDAIRPN